MCSRHGELNGADARCDVCEVWGMPHPSGCQRPSPIRFADPGPAVPTSEVVVEEVEICGCTNEELEDNRTCGQPECPNRGSTYRSCVTCGERVIWHPTFGWMHTERRFDPHAAEVAATS